MLDQIKGLHHVTSLASGAQENNDFFTGTLGLRRVKKTVNFDAPQVYHLYYGNGAGTPGTVMTYFPFPGKPRGAHGVGEVGLTAFAIPTGSGGFWTARLAERGVSGVRKVPRFGEARVLFEGPDGDEFALVENPDGREPWLGADIPEAATIRGFHSVTLRLAELGATAELLQFMGYRQVAQDGNVTRFQVPGGNGAGVVDIEALPGAEAAEQGAGSVHHVAFAVENRAAQLAVRKALLEAGHRVTDVIDRNYFWAIYFRSPGGILFEVATNEPGFAVDEDAADLGKALRLPARHEHLRGELLGGLLEDIKD